MCISVKSLKFSLHVKVYPCKEVHVYVKYIKQSSSKICFTFKSKSPILCEFLVKQIKNSEKNEISTDQNTAKSKSN